MFLGLKPHIKVSFQTVSQWSALSLSLCLRETEFKISLSNQVMPGDPAESEGAGSVISGEQAHLEAAQQVLVALAGAREGGSSAEVVEVNMFDLLNSSVTFICGDKPSEPESLT